MINAILDSGIVFILWLQSLGDWIFGVMRLLSFLGTEEFYLLLLSVLYWGVNATLGVRVGVILLLSNSLNVILKWVFHLPRPYWYDSRIRGLWGESTFGVPSGHSQTPMSIFGLIAATIKRGWVWGITLLLVFLIGFSRMVLGAHFHLDVVVGWTLGVLLLTAFLRFEKPVKAWFDRRRPGKQVLIAFLISFAVILVGVLIRTGVSDVAIPAEWAENARADQPDTTINPFGLNDLINLAASLFGLVAGVCWLRTRGGFDAGGEYWKRGVRILIGLIGVVILWMGLAEVFPQGANLPAYGLRFLRYCLIALWIAAGAPVLFIRLGLAKKAPADKRFDAGQKNI